MVLMVQAVNYFRPPDDSRRHYILLPSYLFFLSFFFLSTLDRLHWAAQLQYHVFAPERNLMNSLSHLPVRPLNFTAGQNVCDFYAIFDSFLPLSDRRFELYQFVWFISGFD